MGRRAVQDKGAAIDFAKTTGWNVSVSNIDVTPQMCYMFTLFYRGVGSGGVPRLFNNTASANSNFGIGGTLYPGIFSFGAWLNTNVRPSLGKYERYIAIMDGTAVSIYKRGELIYSGANTAIVAGTGTLQIGGNSTDVLDGKLSDVAQLNRVPTSAEIADYTDFAQAPTDVEYFFDFNEGAGSIAYDSSGNGNDGTITGATWSSDTPSKARKQVGGNLVKNGDFSYIPRVNVLQTVNGWIDGTAGGGGTSTTPQPFSRYMFRGGADATAEFEEGTGPQGQNVLKLATTATGAYIEARYNSPNLYGTVGIKDVIPADPSTSYTLTFKAKTNYTSGDATNGFNVFINEGNGARVGVTTKIPISYIKTTTDWTEYTYEWTTNSATRFIAVEPVIYGHQGTATLIMEAWATDIVIRKTSDIARDAA